MADMNMRRFSRETQRNYIRDMGRSVTFMRPAFVKGNKGRLGFASASPRR